MPFRKVLEPADASTIRYDPIENHGQLRTGSLYTGQYRDLPYLILFIVHFGILAGLAGVFYTDLNSVQTGDVKVDSQMMYGVGASLGTTITFSIAWLFMIQACATCLLWTSIFFTLAMMVAGLVFMLMYGSMMGALLMALVVAIQICWIFCVRDRIALAAVMLEIVSEVTQLFWGIFVSSVLMIGVAAAVMGLWGYSAFCVFSNVESDNGRYACALFYLLSLFWIMNVKRYVVHCTAAGATGSWYFSYSEQNPAAAVGSSAASLGRALSTSLGSICYGGLIIAIIEVMRVLARSLQDRDNNIAVQFIGCCLECILNCIEDILEYINSYAFTICAIYGDDYCTAVGKTMNLFCTNGFDMIINDDLIEGVLFMGAIACGAVGAGAGYLGATNGSSDEQITCAVAGGVIGIGMMSIVNATIISCVKSLFVCFAQDPLVMYNTKRSKYDKLTLAWQRRWPGGIPCQAYLNHALNENPQPCGGGGAQYQQAPQYPQGPQGGQPHWGAAPQPSYAQPPPPPPRLHSGMA